MLEKELVMIIMDDVYNYLNEKGEIQDEDIYDYVCVVVISSYFKDLDDYSNIYNMDDGIIMLGGIENDDYFILEYNQMFYNDVLFLN